MPTSQSPRQEHPAIVAELNLIACFPVCRERDRRAWALVLRPELQQIAKRVTRRWRSAAIAGEDLAQTSMIGLKRAVDGFRFGHSWGEFMASAEQWVRHELQLLAGQHRTVHLTDDLMRSARKAQLLSRKGLDAEQIAEEMGSSAEEVGELLSVPLHGGRSELTVAAAGRASFRPDCEDRVVGALDWKRAGRGLIDSCNMGEAQPELPVVAHVVADRQPRLVVKKVRKLPGVVEQRQLALV